MLNIAVFQTYLKTCKTLFYLRFGIQFHPEVTHTPNGKILLNNFIVSICKCNSDWTMGNFVQESIEEIKKMVGEKNHVIGAVSGGVDSSVAALLLNRAIGSRFHAILVDNGLLRKNESEEVIITITQRF